MIGKEDIERMQRNVGNYRPKKKPYSFWKILIYAILINTAVTSAIYRMKHPEKTETQAFFHIPKSFIYNFK